MIRVLFGTSGGRGEGAVLHLKPASRPPRGAPEIPPPPAPQFSRELENRLGLSDDQRQKIRTLLDEGRKEGDAIRRELRPRLEQQIDAVCARIEAVLTPEQRAKFQEILQEDRRRAERFLIEGGPPRPDGPPR